MDSKTVVIYHADCTDGFASAFAAWLKLGNAATYIPAQYGQPSPPAAWEAERVYILDFSYPRSVLEGLAGGREVRVLDHHRTAQAELAGLPYVTFDMHKSGAVLSWEFFHPGEPIPALLLYVQDRDLWRWQLPDSREVSAALSLEPRDFRYWGRMIRDHYYPDEHPALWQSVIYTGQVVLKHQAKLVAGLCDHAVPRVVAGHSVPSVNAPILQSEVGEELCRRHSDAPFAATFFIDGGGDEIWSLRSRGDFDVSEVAKRMGGGGHRNSAGFSYKNL
jgi:uncharacterized protein